MELKRPAFSRPDLKMVGDAAQATTVSVLQTSKIYTPQSDSPSACIGDTFTLLPFKESKALA